MPAVTESYSSEQSDASCEKALLILNKNSLHFNQTFNMVKARLLQFNEIQWNMERGSWDCPGLFRTKCSACCCLSGEILCEQSVHETILCSLNKLFFWFIINGHWLYITNKILMRSSKKHFKKKPMLFSGTVCRNAPFQPNKNKEQSLLEQSCY